MCPTSSAMTTKDPEVPTVDYYDILGCNPHSDNDQIQTEYRVRARQVHPDKSSMKAGGGNEWNQVREAYEVLSDPVSRAQYDRWRKAKLPVSFSQWRQYPHSQTMHWSFDYQR
ncbi:DnaJ sub C member 12, partial [Coemansia sp. RSA 2618]